MQAWAPVRLCTVWTVRAADHLSGGGGPHHHDVVAAGSVVVRGGGARPETAGPAAAPHVIGGIGIVITAVIAGQALPPVGVALQITADCRGCKQPSLNLRHSFVCCMSGRAGCKHFMA